MTPEAKARLTTWIVEQRRSDPLPPLITIDEIKRATSRAPLPVSEKQARALLYLARASKWPGQDINIAGQVDEGTRRFWNEFQVETECAERKEAGGLIKLLEDLKFVTLNPRGWSIRMNAEGWEKVETLRSSNVGSSSAFVAMWFNPVTRPAYEGGIRLAVADTGWVPIRIDGKEHSNKIDDEIIAEIRRSRFVIADFTAEKDKPRGGVYFEAGFAMGLGRPVIWTVRDDMINDVHFDTRQYNHITWSTPEELRHRLTARIGAVIGIGPVSRPLR